MEHYCLTCLSRPLSVYLRHQNLFVWIHLWYDSSSHVYPPFPTSPLSPPPSSTRQTFLSVGRSLIPLTLSLEDYTNISIFVWEVTSVVDLDSTGQGNFHLKLVPPSYNGLPDIGVDSMAFTIRNSSVTNSSRASTSSSITSTTKISTTSTASTTTTSSLPPTTYPATITPSNVPAASSSRLSSSTRLGLGIGLGIGLVVFILLNAFAIIWYVRRWYLRQPSKAAQTANDENTHDAVNSAQYRPVGPVWEVDGNGLKSELSAWERREGVGELDGNAVRAELSATRK